ncbi:MULTISPECIES: phytoene desaturase family protein [Asaia]|uniref:Phytoene desaturase, neurosporene or lycopene producing n=2 Tax=Asaia TaxID=91914 RepID=A0A060QLI5_9PROT|nr:MULTISPECIES: phytoene desaturase family protein [Asaia]MDL2169641.1 phytoene desaturase family protein [Asaia sp. HumB]CDG40377.1 Phytoene desaturase, neurosporene or lycopene producing [Asaia bogorensis]
MVSTASPGTQHSRHRLHSRNVAVIGAGPGGLASAMLLAHAGANVTIYEKGGRIGGRSSCIELEGFRFDTGPTFFLYPEIIREIFAQCGFKFDEMVELERLHHLYDLRFEDGPNLSLTTDPQRLEEEIAKISPQDARQVRRFLADNRNKFERFIAPLQRPFNSVFDLFKPDMLKALPVLSPFSSIDKDLSRYFSDPRTRLAFSFQSKYLGMSPYRCPSLFTILSFMEHEFGIYHPKGGTEAVMAAMAQAATTMGVRIELNSAVETIETSKGKTTGIVANGSAVPVDAVVVNGDFARTISALLPGNSRKKWSDENIASKKFSCSTFMMYLGLKGSLPDHAHHTIFLSSDYENNFAEIEAGKQISSKASLYIQNACVTDPGQAPEGCSALYVLMPVGNLRQDGFEWDEANTAQARAIVFQRLRDAGFGDIEERILVEKTITPLQWQEEHDVHRGAVFNMAHSLGQMLHRRPHNRFEDVKGVYLAGGGTHPGSGLPVIFEGARISATLLIEDLAKAPATIIETPPPGLHLMPECTGGHA